MNLHTQPTQNTQYELCTQPNPRENIDARVLGTYPTWEDAWQASTRAGEQTYIRHVRRVDPAITIFDNDRK